MTDKWQPDEAMHIDETVEKDDPAVVEAMESFDPESDSDFEEKSESEQSG